MNPQYDIFEVHQFENNISNQKILDQNKPHFSNQCKIVYEALLRGEKLTVRDAMVKYGIGDLRRRVKDLIDHNNIPVQSRMIDSRTKEWFLNKG